MKILFNKILSRHSLFWRYFLLLSVFMLIFLGALTLTIRQSAQALQQSYLTQAEEAFYHDCESFASDLLRVSSLPAGMEHSRSYIDTLLASRPFTPAMQLQFSSLRESFAAQSVYLNLSNGAFLYNDRLQLCFTRSQLFLSAYDCFETGIRYQQEENLLGILHNTLNKNSLFTISFLPCQPVSSDGSEYVPQLTLLYSIPSRKQVYGVLYTEDTILKSFRIPHLPQDSYFRLIDADGTTLLSYGADSPASEEYTQFSSSLTGLSITAVIGIPHAYFRDMILQSQTTANLTLIICFVLGVLFCFLYSHMSILPFRRLIREHSPNHSDEPPVNELIAIDSFLQTAQDRISSLRSMLLSSLVIRTVSDSPSPKETARMEQLYNQVSPHAVTLRNLDQLRKSLTTWNEAEVLEQIESSAATMGGEQSPNPEDFFYGILFLLQDTAGSGNLDFSAHADLAYQPSLSPAENIRRLSVVATDLFRQRSALQQSERQMLREDIVLYIRRSYSDSALCLTSVAQHFDVSDRYVQLVVQDLTAQNFGDFLNQLRVEESARLLRSTDLSINAISAQCGYPVLSTFYRNFRKHFHVTPAEYRASRGTGTGDSPGL